MKTMWDELREKHGESLSLTHNQRIYADGTEVSGNDYLSIIEPPMDEHGRLRARRKFLAAKHEQEVRDWKRFQSDCSYQAAMHQSSPSTCPSPPANSVEQLEAGKERIMALRAEIAEIDEQLPDMQVRQNSEERARSDHSRVQQLRNEILTIEI